MSERSSSGYIVPYKIPLAGFEKALLREIEPILLQSGLDIGQATDEKIAATFSDWRWPELVAQCLKDDLVDDLDRYHGDYAAAYQATIHFLAHTGGEEQNLARANLLRSANPDFLANLAGRTINDFEAVRAEEDVNEWRIIWAVNNNTPSLWKFDDALDSASEKYEIWQLLRMFSIHWLQPDRLAQVENILSRDSKFFKNYTMLDDESSTAKAEADRNHADRTDGTSENKVVGEEKIKKHNGKSEQNCLIERFHKMQFQKRVDSSSLPKWPEGEPKVDESGKITDAFLAHQIRLLGRSRKIQDPRSFLHFIPWEQLTLADEDTVRSSGISLKDSFSDSVLFGDVLLWRTPHPGFVWNHHLHTEDEVFEYCIREAWQLPDHCINDSVVYISTPLDTSDFIVELDQFWPKWNDCAITQASPADPTILLQTIPGIRFRSRWDRQDKKSAISYFRNMVEAHASDSLEPNLVRDIIGLEPGYQPRFEHSLKVIPPQQLDLDGVNWANPLGKGENGAVYPTTWKRLPGVLSTSLSGEKKVLLKEVLPRQGESRRALDKFMKELDTTYASLGGNAVGCTEFVGITFLPARNADPTTFPPRSRSGSYPVSYQFYLVFEQASRGTVRECLIEEVQNKSFVKSWDITANALSSIGNGLVTLHEHNVIHRDLHPNNILATEKSYDDPEFPVELSFLVSDIGEGKVLRPEAEKVEKIGKTRHRASYGAIDYRAPEIPRGEKYTTASDVFSYGVIACRMMDCRYDACKAPPPEHVLLEVENLASGFKPDMEHMVYVVPKLLKNAIAPCLARNPQDRPQMRPVVHALNDCTMQFFENNVQWAYWNWDETLAAAKSVDLTEKRRPIISNEEFDVIVEDGGEHDGADDDLIVVRPNNVNWEDDT